MGAGELSIESMNADSLRALEIALQVASVAVVGFPITT
jgi:hypothetical protein